MPEATVLVADDDAGMRSNGKRYDPPIVEVWKPGDSPVDRSVVDLCQNRELRIVRALVSLDDE